MKIKDIFAKSEGGTLTYEEFTAIMKQENANFTDLSEGKYVSKQKYDDDIKGKEDTITTLNSTIATRDTDLQGLKTQLEQAGTDKTKLEELNGQLSTLQTKYDNDTQEYKAKLSKQAYEFAVKEFANGKKFSSNAAKRDFINEMLKKNLTMDNSKILGAEDFVTAYSAENADAFVKDEPNPTPAPAKPTFVQPTAGEPKPNDGAPGGFEFNFTGIRPKEK